MRLILRKLVKGKKVQDTACQLMTLNVQDLLDYAQINASKFQLNIMRFNIIEFIENVIEMQQDKAEDQGIELTYEYNGIESDEMVTTDSGRLT